MTTRFARFLIWLTLVFAAVVTAHGQEILKPAAPPPDKPAAEGQSKPEAGGRANPSSDNNPFE